MAHELFFDTGDLERGQHSIDPEAAKKIDSTLTAGLEAAVADAARSTAQRDEADEAAVWDVIEPNTTEVTLLEN